MNMISSFSQIQQQQGIFSGLGIQGATPQQGNIAQASTGFPMAFDMAGLSGDLTEGFASNPLASIIGSSSPYSGIGLNAGLGMIPGFGGAFNPLGSLFGGLVQQNQMVQMMMLMMMQMMMNNMGGFQQPSSMPADMFGGALASPSASANSSAMAGAGSLPSSGAIAASSGASSGGGSVSSGAAAASSGASSGGGSASSGAAAAASSGASSGGGSASSGAAKSSGGGSASGSSGATKSSGGGSASGSSGAAKSSGGGSASGSSGAAKSSGGGSASGSSGAAKSLGGGSASGSSGAAKSSGGGSASKSSEAASKPDDKKVNNGQYSAEGRPHGLSGIKAEFGEPGRNQVTVSMPCGKGGAMQKVTCHKEIADRMKAAFEEVKRQGLSDKIKTFDGCFCDRLKRGGSTKSVHSWGIAFDINAAENPMRKGQKPTADQAKLAAVFEKFGFYNLPGDPMHFQFATGY